MSKIILVVDDAEDIAGSIADLLQEYGYSVSSVNSAVAALNFIPEVQPDLIICDVLMPKMTGLQFMKILRADPETSFIPVVFLSAAADMEYINKGMMAGAASYITKPFKSKALLDIIKQILG